MSAEDWYAPDDRAEVDEQEHAETDPRPPTKPMVIAYARACGVFIETRDSAMAAAWECTLPDTRASLVTTARRANHAAIDYMRRARAEWDAVQQDLYGLRANLEDMEREIQELRR